MPAGCDTPFIAATARCSPHCLWPRRWARFFKNNGDGTFTERTEEANLMGIVSGLNVVHADYDNDGDRDIFIMRGAWLVGGTHPNSLLRNNASVSVGPAAIHGTISSGCKVSIMCSSWCATWSTVPQIEYPRSRTKAGVFGSAPSSPGLRSASLKPNQSCQRVQM